MCRKERKFQTTRVETRRRPPSSPRRQRQKLKAERVQEALKAMPGWTLRPDGKAISCTRRFTHPAGVAEFASFVAVLAVAGRHPVGVAICGGQVSVTLPARLGAYGFTPQDLELARQLG